MLTTMSKTIDICKKAIFDFQWREYFSLFRYFFFTRGLFSFSVLEKYVVQILLNVLTFFVFGNYLGSSVYIPGDILFENYLAPGFLIQVATIAAASEGSIEMYLLKYRKGIETINASPVDNIVLILALLSSCICRAFNASFFFLFRYPQVFLQNSILVFLVASLAGLLGIFTGMIANNFGESFYSTLILQLLNLFSGSLFDVNSLTEQERFLIQFNPNYIFTSIARANTLGTELNLFAPLPLVYFILAVCIILAIRQLSSLYDTYLRN